MDDKGPLCLSCADIGHLVFLPAGDTALTRRARKASGLSAVVVRFSRARKRYERQGILVEEEALERAEAECLADADARARRRERERSRRAEHDLAFETEMAAEIVRLYPGCPRDRAEEVARHTGARGSGRVGRSAAGRALLDGAGRIVSDQFARRGLRSQRPSDMPLSTSPMDGLIEPVRAALHPRRYGLKNRERTNRLLLLMQLHANRQDGVLAYAKSIRAWLEPNGGRPRVARRAVTDPGDLASLR